MDIYQYTWNAGHMIFGLIGTKNNLKYKLDGHVSEYPNNPFYRNDNILSFHLKLIY